MILHNLQNNLNSVEALLSENNKTGPLTANSLPTAPNFLNQYVSGDQDLNPFDYNNMFLDGSFYLQPSIGLNTTSSTNMPVISNNSLEFNMNPKSGPPNIELGSSIPNYEEDIEEIATEPPPMGTLSTIPSTSPFHENLH